jgi:hypothetical protein
MYVIINFLPQDLQDFPKDGLSQLFMLRCRHVELILLAGLCRQSVTAVWRLKCKKALPEK